MGEMAYEFVFKNKTLGGDDGFGDIVRIDLGAFGIDLNDPSVFALALLLIVGRTAYVRIVKHLEDPG